MLQLQTSYIQTTLPLLFNCIHDQSVDVWQRQTNIPVSNTRSFGELYGSSAPRNWFSLS